MISLFHDHSPLLTKWGIGMFAAAFGLTISALEEIKLYVQIAAAAMAFLASAATFIIVILSAKKKKNNVKDHPEHP